MWHSNKEDAMTRNQHAVFFAAALLTPAWAMAQSPSPPTPEDQLPAPRSDNDPRPPVARPDVPEHDKVTKQAGIGGTQAYGRAGVLELGGSFGMSAAADFSQVSVTPSIGWFFVDNLELSALLGYNRVSADGESSTYFTGLIEPSYHLPLNNASFIFAGMGAGVAYAEGPGAGFSMAPRLGLNMMVGRSGVFTPALTMVYSTGDAIQTSQGALLAVSTSYGFNAGYTVMW